MTVRPPNTAPQNDLRRFEVDLDGIIRTTSLVVKITQNTCADWNRGVRKPVRITCLPSEQRAFRAN
jgi:hypothetical protein